MRLKLNGEQVEVEAGKVTTKLPEIKDAVQLALEVGLPNKGYSPTPQLDRLINFFGKEAITDVELDTTPDGEVY